MGPHMAFADWSPNLNGRIGCVSATHALNGLNKWDHFRHGLSFVANFIPLCSAERGRFAGSCPVALSDDGRFLAG